MKAALWGPAVKDRIVPVLLINVKDGDGTIHAAIPGADRGRRGALKRCELK